MLRSVLRWRDDEIVDLGEDQSVPLSPDPAAVGARSDHRVPAGVRTATAAMDERASIGLTGAKGEQPEMTRTGDRAPPANPSRRREAPDVRAPDLDEGGKTVSQRQAEPFTLLDMVPEQIFVLRPNLKVEYANKAWSTTTARR